MYVPRHFAMDSREDALAFVRANSFAVLVSTEESGLPFATHVPLLVDPSGQKLIGHLARANPHWQLFDGTRAALAVFAGPHAYVSPRWYASAPQVPTWNYVAVHVTGKPRIVEDGAVVRDMLDKLGQANEGDYPNAWSFTALPEKYVEGMIRGIVAFEIPIESVEGKAKLSQNKNDADVAGAVAGLSTTGSPEARAVADLMERARP